MLTQVLRSASGKLSAVTEVNEQIDRLSGLRFQWPSFPPSLEASFEAGTGPRRAKRLAFEGLIAVFLYNLFLLVDRIIIPVDFNRAVILRLAIVTPIALLINIFLWRHPGKFFREAGMSIGTIVAALAHLYLESSRNAINSAYAQFGLLVIIVYANTVVRLRFPYALTTSCVLVTGEAVFLHQDAMLLPSQKLVGLALFLIATFVTLIANYSTNREERLNYLLTLRGDLLVLDLHHSNERLADQAESDGLTGLNNRVGFETRFDKLWKEAHRNQTPLSVIMVDVDHFKRTNDTYGHLYGDKVLKRIAHLILEALRKDTDYAARFGGEEFVLLLPQTDESAAMLVAERLRRLVEVAGFPPVELSRHSFDSINATVSCGVCTVIPGKRDDRQQLIHAADKALYAAKAAGRNRVFHSFFVNSTRPATPIDVKPPAGWPPSKIPA